ncbi:phosphoenolpyruvate--protein phosphotransferase [Sansalvadorimonas sp. 2012CJ34-2]|uniref:Phosphoenolpyruvate--protein phosphotransferase n=1 Tax=Parendozoicomonas callyspongiae TaxID=2942213 RepID=A0ABT0PIM6_9GAMM|nr:phosphoenolpyruvate--protein phosphotransferase [Sansalvadorimonas sp. 2012CJ34-2]MCL6271249.1 phosphoenolpyruvate--protein phosphotransferase [Sansalvadorimonas sp. 2012CJ34-2]
MVGIVIVSHSRKLAEGVLELAEQMNQGQCSLAAAGGIDDQDNPIGTDAIRIMTAIEQVYDHSGVLVLMDMGSALLSTETALDLIAPNTSANITLCSAPLVEGAIAATVAASAGMSLNEVAREACSALSAKQEHLGDESVVISSSPEPTPDLDRNELKASWVIQNPHGLHARPAANLVSELAQFDIEGTLSRESKSANIRSLNSIAALDARCHDEIHLAVSGPDAQKAIGAFLTLAKRHFGEDISTKPQSEVIVKPHKQEGAINGQPASEGIVFGRAKHFCQVMPEVPERIFLGEKAEWQTFTQALEKTLTELQVLEQESTGKMGSNHSAIFAAHKLILSDPELLDRVQSCISKGHSSEQAWIIEIGSLTNQYKNAESEYMQQRAYDVVDIGRRLLANLLGTDLPHQQLDSPAILLVDDLTPSDTACLDSEKVLGICLSQGGRTSHSAILARALGIPAIVCAEGCLEKIHDGQQVILDGFHGQIWAHPDAQTITKLELRRTEWLVKKSREAEDSQKDAETLDGFCPDVMANISKPEEVISLQKVGARGVGLLRTEFLFLDQQNLPGEKEQCQIYCDIASKLGSDPLIIRTLDIGGDKPMHSVRTESEANPFLGCRGIRLSLRYPELFKSQLKAIIRAADLHSNIQIMFPMVATVDELHKAKELLNECRRELHIPVPELKIGIMIEVPAAVFNAEQLAKESDFFSLGTNDLAQYVMAADRGNASVSGLAHYQQSAILKAIAKTCNAAGTAGIPVGICGEMAGDPEFTSLLLGMGVTKFSASPTAIPALKASIRNVDMAQAKQEALACF